MRKGAPSTPNDEVLHHEDPAESTEEQEIRAMSLIRTIACMTKYPNQNADINDAEITLNWLIQEARDIVNL